MEDKNLLSLTEPEMRRVRGNEIAMIFQEPMTSLNPVLTIGDQLCESFMIHSKMRRREAWGHSRELLQLVRIPDADGCLSEYPHRLSGGMRQRIMIAMAVACRPKLLIADEPTTALDVTIQAQVLRLLMDLREQLGMSLLLITHDLGVVAENAERVAVMYAGRIVEEASVSELFSKAMHPYTRGLMAARPHIDDADNFRTTRLSEIPGNVPSLRNLPAGCAFVPRCPERMPVCSRDRPNLIEIGTDRRASCFLVTGR
jgi:peptide/nickel transport system ATP-binding protein